MMPEEPEQSPVGPTSTDSDHEEMHSATGGSEDAEDDDDQWLTTDSESDADDSAERDQDFQRRKEEKARQEADGLPSGCHHYDRLCKIVAPCWYAPAMKRKASSAQQGGLLVSPLSQ